MPCEPGIRKKKIYSAPCLHGRGEDLLFYMLCYNKNESFEVFEFAVGERRTYIPLYAGGYMFPQTKHVETLVLLQLK